MSENLNKNFRADKSLTATGIVLLIITALLITAYIGIDITLRRRAIRRMEECVETITEEYERSCCKAF